MPEFLIIRHGQSQADLEDRYEGRADFPLTAEGRAQAAQLARWLATHYRPDAIYASPLIRAAETAQIIATQVHVPIHLEPDLMEWNNGVLAGLLREEADRKYPTPAEPRKLHESVPGGETDIEFRARAASVWSRLEHQTPESQRIAIVAHGGIISQLFHCFMNLPFQTGFWLMTGDTGVHLWKIKGATRWLIFSNSLIHLRQEAPNVGLQNP
ncbi:MAG: histidine phosphatase family protein [Anaerolineales bacterium]|nr:histidine phosphatase family protein [Anaerolineales bacterium]